MNKNTTNKTEKKHQTVNEVLYVTPEAKAELIDKKQQVELRNYEWWQLTLQLGEILKHYKDIVDQNDMDKYDYNLAVKYLNQIIKQTGWIDPIEPVNN